MHKVDVTSIVCARIPDTEVWIRTSDISWSGLDWCGCLGWLLVAEKVRLEVILTQASGRPDDAPSFGMNLLA